MNESIVCVNLWLCGRMVVWLGKWMDMWIDV